MHNARFLPHTFSSFFYRHVSPKQILCIDRLSSIYIYIYMVNMLTKEPNHVHNIVNSILSRLLLFSYAPWVLWMNSTTFSPQCANRIYIHININVSRRPMLSVADGLRLFCSPSDYLCVEILWFGLTFLGVGYLWALCKVLLLAAAHNNCPAHRRWASYCIVWLFLLFLYLQW